MSCVATCIVTIESSHVSERHSLWARGLAAAPRWEETQVKLLLSGAGAPGMWRLYPLAEAPMGVQPAQLPPPALVLRLPLLLFLMVCTAETITATRNPGTSFFQLSGFY